MFQTREREREKEGNSHRAKPTRNLGKENKISIREDFTNDVEESISRDSYYFQVFFPISLYSLLTLSLLLHATVTASNKMHVATSELSRIFLWKFVSHEIHSIVKDEQKECRAIFLEYIFAAQMILYTRSPIIEYLKLVCFDIHRKEQTRGSRGRSNLG